MGRWSSSDAHRGLQRCALWSTLLHGGNLTTAYTRIEHGLAFDNPQDHSVDTMFYDLDDPGVCGQAFAAKALWFLGYPDRLSGEAMRGNHPSAGVGHPFSLAFAHIQAAALHHLRRDVPATFRHAEAALALGAERGFQHLSGIGMILQGWALAAQQCEEGLGLMRQGLAALQATGGMHLLSWFRGALVGLYCDMGQMTEGLATLDEALAVVEAADQRYFEAEIYRLKGG
jgi:predicted ATPase